MKPIISISHDAQLHFKNILKKREEKTHLRIFIKELGMPSATCGLCFCPLKDVTKNDDFVAFDLDDIYLYYDRSLSPFLKDAEINLKEIDGGKQITVKAPFLKEQELDESAPIFDQVNYIIVYQINPMLASHGGAIKLIDIDEGEGVVKIAFSGGCNGCSMANVTLHSVVKEELLNCFPSLKSVLDVTSHRKGDHSYL